MASKKISRKSSLNKKTDYEWNSKFTLTITKPPNINLTLKLDKENVKYSDSITKPSHSLINSDIYMKLIENKDKIGKYESMNKIHLWLKWSRLVNPYEKIGQVSNIVVEKSISRAFYKLYEILKLNNLGNPQNSLHLCEAPGGFVSATKHLYPNINWNAQSLYEGGDKLNISETLEPDNPEKWLRSNTNGDITNIETIYSLSNIKYNLITADGGFDVSNDPNNQEQLSFKLIFSEILTALHYQNEKGMLVCKIFDIFTKPTYQIILLLTKYYNNVKIIKPRTSRFTNSEKYIVAKNFMGINNEDLVFLDNILINWNNTYCKDIGINLKNKLIDLKLIKKYNGYITNIQSWYIHQALYYSKNNNEDKEHELKTIQNKKAPLFCKAFDLMSNKENCKHTYITKIESITNINIYNCNNCLQMIVNF